MWDASWSCLACCRPKTNSGALHMPCRRAQQPCVLATAAAHGAPTQAPHLRVQAAAGGSLHDRALQHVGCHVDLGLPPHLGPANQALAQQPGGQGDAQRGAAGGQRHLHHLKPLLHRCRAQYLDSGTAVQAERGGRRGRRLGSSCSRLGGDARCLKLTRQRARRDGQGYRGGWGGVGGASRKTSKPGVWGGRTPHSTAACCFLAVGACWRFRLRGQVACASWHPSNPTQLPLQCSSCRRQIQTCALDGAGAVRAPSDSGII